jgi:hypothetical protein
MFSGPEVVDLVVPVMLTMWMTTRMRYDYDYNYDVDDVERSQDR